VIIANHTRAIDQRQSRCGAGAIVEQIGRAQGASTSGDPHNTGREPLDILFLYRWRGHPRRRLIHITWWVRSQPTTAECLSRGQDGRFSLLAAPVPGKSSRRGRRRS
jgi:hypothetical protein